MEHEMVRNQKLSPLFTVLPKELRDLVFEYALTDSKTHSVESLLQRNVSFFKSNPYKSSTNDIAVNLLRTCRAIYFETWTSPLSLNPHIEYNLESTGDAGVNLRKLLPWQISLIQSLDITLQQTSLEGENRLQNYLHRHNSWQVGQRHKGVYIAPRQHKTPSGPRSMDEYPASFECSLIPAEDKPQPRHFLSHLLGTHHCYPENPELHPPWSSAMRVTLANPIVHLTLRIPHKNWWTWTEDPNSSNDLHHLGLDPSVGNGTAVPLARPTASRMRALAAERRAGRHPEIVPGIGWAGTISQMRDLKSLELVLQTFRRKQRQLDDVVDAAKTWKFPIAETQWELVWDGEVDMSGWSWGPKTEVPPRVAPLWYMQSNEFEVRIVRYVRRRVV
jgi:hypothetical protein